jgi:proteasome accessory factor C
MPRTPEHLPRLLALVRALSKTRVLPLARLCDELGVSEADLRADIELLSLCGLPPYGPDNLIEIQVVGDRVRLSNRVLTPPALMLSDEEAAGMRLALKIAEAEGWPETRALRSAVKKLEDALLPERREGGRRLAKRVGVSRGRGAAGDRWLATVRHALATATSVDLTYYSDGREAVSERRVDPYQLVLTERARYLVGYCHVRKAVLTFRVDRILRARRTTARFAPPVDFKVADYVGDRGKDPTMVAVTVRFTADVARIALESYPGAKPAPGGAAVWKTRVWPTRAFYRQIVSWGGAAEVTAPADVREGVRAYARSVRERYTRRGASMAGEGGSR